MTIIATARIPERIDQSPTERLPRVLPELPPTVTGALHWANVDIKPELATCPAWCAEHIETDGLSVFHSSRRAAFTVTGGTVQESIVDVVIGRIDDPGVVGPVIVELNNNLMSAEEARQAAALLTVHADMAEGRQGSQLWAAYQVGRTTGERYDVGKAEADRTWTAALDGVLADVRGRSVLGRLRWALRLAFTGPAAADQLTGGAK